MDGPLEDATVAGEAKKRPCLKCGKEFYSRSFRNRLCPVCNRENEAVRDVQRASTTGNEP